MVGYCWRSNVSLLPCQLHAQWLAGSPEIYCLLRTEVILTPQSNSGVTGDGAGGVSTHSKFSSDVLLLIFAACRRILQTLSKALLGLRFWRAVS